MQENNIPANDLNSAVAPRLAELQLPQDVHYNLKGYEFLGDLIADAIKPHLKAP